MRPMYTKEKIAARLRAVREDRGLTATEIASELGMTKSTYINYEAAVCSPKLNTLITIATYYQVTLDFLLGLNTSDDEDVLILDICRYTGLSREAVAGLHKSRHHKIKWR